MKNRITALSIVLLSLTAKAATVPMYCVGREPDRKEVNTHLVFSPMEDGWADIAGLSFDLLMPTNAPTNAQILAYVKDPDFFWYQKLLPRVLKPGSRNRLEVSFLPTTEGWKPVGHQAAWHLRAMMKPREVGIRVFAPTRFEGNCRVENIAGLRRKPDSTPPTIEEVTPSGSKVRCFERFELTFRLPDRYMNPFDTNVVSVSATFYGPDGSTSVVAGYYRRDFYRRDQETKYDVIPQGTPMWQVRFTPQVKGLYRYKLEVKDKAGCASWGPGHFEALEGNSRGYVRISKKDRRYFEFSDGSFFFPIGHNLRTPSDTRYDKHFPWRKRWIKSATAYRDYFRKMHANGENMTEVWFAPWSMGLEWNPKWRGYRGVGQYNMMNAWLMDATIEEAEKNDIYINLVIHNHGQFSAYSDEQWDYNPFNTINGGYLTSPQQYFTDRRAREAHKQLVRYIISRWGHSPNVFGWELWSELDLTGATYTSYKQPEVRTWHIEMGRAIKAFDPYDHIVGTHVSGSYNKQAPGIISLPEMDYCPMDAYHGSGDPLHIIELLRATAVYNNPYGKPAVVTEFGGNWYSGSDHHLRTTLHAGLWASIATPLASAPMLWWWELIDEEDLYRVFKPVAAFMKDEDFRNPRATIRNVILGLESGLQGVSLRDETKGTGWVYHPHRLRQARNDKQAPIAGAPLVIPRMAKGNYEVEFWHTESGRVITTEVAEAEGGSVKVIMPPFRRDIAFKIRPAKKP